MDRNTSLDHKTFNKLSRIYLAALGAIGLFTVGAQFFIQTYLNNQIQDSRIINISGKQRMLSQKLTKEALILLHKPDSLLRDDTRQKLKNTLEQWRIAHEELRNYNDSISRTSSDSSQIQKMFSQLQPSFEKLYENGLFLASNFNFETDSLLTYQAVEQIIITEPIFLSQMDAIVSGYEKQAKEKVSRLKNIELLLFAIIILILIFEFLFLFRPVTFGIKKTISGLLESRQKAETLAIHTEKLRKIQNENVQELLSLTKALDQTLLYARVNKEGGIITLGDRFAKILKIAEHTNSQKLPELLKLDEIQKERLYNLISHNKGNVFNEEFEIHIELELSIYLDISILPVFKEDGEYEKLVLCSDISRRKEAQQEIEKLTKSKFLQKEELQKLNASQIVEAQEEERKRIAKEIHDSIGQMLTALKFNIESINLENQEKSKQKIEGLKKLSKDLIQGIRVATFNLTPPELKDYGIAIALQKMASQLSKLTGKNIVFKAEQKPENRLDRLVETNLYRVTQEAVNNAIKYADSSFILIHLKMAETMLSILIEDHGKGFDIHKIPEKPVNNAEGGMGIFFMKERINYINGKIFIHSVPGEGTRITINYPLQ